MSRGVAHDCMQIDRVEKWTPGRGFRRTSSLFKQHTNMQTAHTQTSVTHRGRKNLQSKPIRHRWHSKVRMTSDKVVNKMPLQKTVQGLLGHNGSL